jgi:arylsulfatase A-like enzyme
VPDFLPDTPAVREDLALYYDEIARMDAECGEVLDLLDREGLVENTLVVFMGDNGMPFPRAKGSLYDPGIRVPTLARWPSRIKPGVVTKQLMSSIDLPATWLATAGIPVPEKMQGRSLLPLFEGSSELLREAVFAERNWHNTFDPMRCVRTARHKLIYNAQPRFRYRPPGDLERSPSWRSYLEESRKQQGSVLKPHHGQLLEPSRPIIELYDLEADPGEFHNRADDPELTEVRRDLEYKLSDWMHETYDFLPPLWKSYPAAEGPGRRDRL